MNVTKEITRLENSTVKLSATIAKEDVAKAYTDGMAKYAKEIQIPGFRKGHVPVRVLEQKYGEALKAEIVGTLIDDSLNEILNAEENRALRPLPYSQPRLEDAKMPELDVTKDFSYTVTYDVFPTVTVSNFDGIVIKVPQVTITDDDIAKELKAIQERNAMVLDRKDDDTVQTGNIVTVNYAEVENGHNVPGTEREGFVFTVGSGDNIYKVDQDILGMKKGETRSITKTYPEDDLNTEFAGKTKVLSLTVTALKERILPALDDDLAQDVSEKFKTLQDLKDDITHSMELSRDRRIEELKSQSLLDQLVQKNPIELPASMVQAEKDSRWRMIARQYQTTPEQLDRMIAASGTSRDEMILQWAGDSEKMLRSRLIVDELLRQKNISVTPEEVEAEYARIANEAGTTVDEVKEHYKEPQAKEYLVDDVKEHKLYDELYKQVKVQKGDKTSFTDLFKES